MDLKAIFGALLGKIISVGNTITLYRKEFRWNGYTKPMPTYFSDEEVKGLDRELVSMLDMARRSAGIPFRITSGLRTCEANQSVLGVEGSAHIKGLAVDLGMGLIPEGFERDKARLLMVRGLLAAGFIRIICYTRHIHVDLDMTKPSPVLVLGGESH